MLLKVWLYFKLIETTELKFYFFFLTLLLLCENTFCAGCPANNLGENNVDVSLTKVLLISFPAGSDCKSELKGWRVRHRMAKIPVNMCSRPDFVSNEKF